MMLPARAIRENVAYSVLDYLSQPTLMLLAAPVLLRVLGVQQYGTWMLVNSIAASASGLGGGFGEGATKYVSAYRGCGDRVGAARSLLAVLAVNCALGLASAVIMIVLAPWLMCSVFAVPPDLRQAGIIALRISAVLLVVRFTEAVFTAAVRGCEQYRPVVVISVAARVSIIALAVFFALRGHGIVAILGAALGIGVVSLVCQARLAFKVVELNGVWQQAQLRAGVREVFSFGAFTWLRSTLGVFIGYADRLLIAALLGTGPLAYYTLCNQLTQPMPALIASAFNFMFPNLSAKNASGRWQEARRSYGVAAGIAGAVIGVICLTLVVSSKLILRLWLGSAVAAQYHNLLIAVAIGNGLLAIAVVPHYAALALGRSRPLALINVAGGIVSLACTYLLIHKMGVIGAGLTKILVGLIFLYVFNVVRRAFTEEGLKMQGEQAAAARMNALNFAQ